MGDAPQEKKSIFSRAFDIIAPPIENKSAASSATTKPATTGPVVSKPAEKNIDMEMYNSIKEALKGRGKVFHDFMEKTEAMKSIIPDEVARLKATVIAMSVSKEALASAINEIRTGLTVEKGEFNNEIEKAAKMNDKLTSEINMVAKKIEELQVTMDNLLTKKNELEDDLNKKTAKVNEARNIFDATIETINSEIDSLESKLTYL